MLPNVIVIIGISLTFHVLLPCLYYAHMKHVAREKPWNIKTDENYEPKVTLIIPTYNESAVISKRLENLKKLEYPNEKLEVVVVDSDSTDGTAQIARDYVANNDLPFKITLLEQKPRMGKGKALNMALQYATGEIIATSDADSYWNPSVLRVALPFMADPQVGAITGRESLTNINQNIYTYAEDFYRRLYYAIRLGESKLGSTLVFQGELALYKRKVLDKFEDERGSDDTGTVVNIVSRSYRCILVPNAIFYDASPYTWNSRITVKARRGQHLILGFLEAIKLKLKKGSGAKLPLLMNFYLHAVNPIIGVVLTVTLLYLLTLFPFLSIVMLLILLVKRVRIFLVLYSTSNIALLLAIFRCILGYKQLTWKKIDETRVDVSNEENE